MGLQKLLPIYTEPLSKGEMGTILRLMGNNGVICEALFLEAEDRDKPPESLHIPALAFGILANEGCPHGTLFPGEASIHLKLCRSLACRSGRKSKVKTDKASFHPADHASANFSLLCCFPVSPCPE